MNIQVTSDGKGKEQSFEATTEGDGSEWNWNFQWSATAYGATEAEARENLNRAIANVKHQCVFTAA